MQDRSDEYFAGLFDGEGTVGIYCASNGRKTASGSKTYYAVRLSVSGTYLPMIQACCDHFGVGVVRQDKRQMRRLPTGQRIPNAQTKPSFRWHVTRREEIELVLRRLQPFLMEKYDQVEIVLQFIAGELDGQEAKEACQRLKDFTFGDFIEPEARSRGRSAENNPSARLTYEQAQTIRERVREGERQADIARELGVSKTMISRIIQNKTYTKPPRCV